MQLSIFLKIGVYILTSRKVLVTVTKGHMGFCCITLVPLHPNSTGQLVSTSTCSNYFCVIVCRMSMQLTVEEMSVTNLLFPHQTIIAHFPFSLSGQRRAFLISRSFQLYKSIVSTEIQHNFLTNPSRFVIGSQKQQIS